jgi:hypothetical protein
MWVEQRKERLLPVHYFHVVFTLPAELRAVARRNQREVYKLLFDAASSTLLTLGEDPERLGARLALTCVLHTWTRELDFHPHVHCIVTGGGLSLDGTQWKSARTKYLFPVQVMSALFRGLFLDGLQKKVARGQVRLDEQDLQALLDKLYQTDWVVYAKAPFGGPEQVFQYLGRYTHRVGISNQRLISMGPDGVCFATKGGRTVTLSAQEFIRRFLLHVLPHGFVKLRHYGLWASGRAQEKLERARDLLTAAGPSNSSPSQIPAPAAAALLQDLSETAETDDTAETDEQEERTLQQRLLRLCGIDLTCCPKCKTGRMVAKPLAVTDPATWPSSQVGANTS